MSYVSAISHSSADLSTNISSRMESTSKGVYDGERLDGLRHGYGIYTSESGSVYKGYWRDDLKHGRFECYLSNGETYIGEFIALYMFPIRWNVNIFNDLYSQAIMKMALGRDLVYSHMLMEPCTRVNFSKTKSMVKENLNMDMPLMRAIITEVNEVVMEPMYALQEMFMRETSVSNDSIYLFIFVKNSV